MTCPAGNAPRSTKRDRPRKAPSGTGPAEHQAEQAHPTRIALTRRPSSLIPFVAPARIGGQSAFSAFALNVAKLEVFGLVIRTA